MATTIKRDGVDRSAGYTPDELSAITLVLTAADGEVGMGSLPVPDPDGSQTPYAGELVEVIDGATNLYQGFLGGLDRDRGQVATGDRLVDVYQIGDENAVLHGFFADEWERPEETTKERFLAFLEDFVPWVTNTTWVTDDAVEDMEENTYTTESLFDELFTEIKDLTGCVAFVENHRAHLHPPTVGISGSLAFSDDEGDWDSTTLPLYNPKRAKDPIDLRTKVRVKSPTASYTATDATAIGRHSSSGIVHEALYQLEKGKLATVTKKANAILADLKKERITYEFDTGLLTAAQLASIPQGCLIEVTSYAMGLSASTQRIASLSASYVHPGRWKAHIECGYPIRKRALASATAPIAAAVAAMACCPPWDGIGSPGGGDDVLNEFFWSGDGATTAGSTDFPYLAGSLSVWVSGLNTTGHVTEDDPTTGAFSLDFAPTAGQVVRGNYTAA